MSELRERIEAMFTARENLAQAEDRVAKLTDDPTVQTYLEAVEDRAKWRKTTKKIEADVRTEAAWEAKSLGLDSGEIVAGVVQTAKTTALNYNTKRALRWLLENTPVPDLYVTVNNRGVALLRDIALALKKHDEFPDYGFLEEEYAMRIVGSSEDFIAREDEGNAG